MACVSDQLSELLSSQSAQFLTPSPSLHKEWVAATKRYLDPLALDISQAQSRRASQRQRKRKRSGGLPGPSLQLQEVHVDGFTERQVWEQANRVLKASSEETVRDVGLLEELYAREPVAESDGDNSEPSILDSDRLEEDAVQSLQSGGEDESDEGMSDLQNSSADDRDIGKVDEQDYESDDGNSAKDDEEDTDMKAGPPKKDDGSSEKHGRKTRGDAYGLNDDFFSLEAFNAQSSFFERKDAKGGDADEESNDEEPVNWDTDPLSQGLSGMPDLDEDESDQDGDEDMDVDAEDDRDDDDLGSVASDEAGGDIMYDDFFDPPASKAPKRQPASQDTQRPAQDLERDLEGDIERSMRDVRRDLFEEDESDLGDETVTDGKASSKTVPQSSHESRRAKITQQIQQLEAMSVTKRDWTLSGEAQAADRPVNSLIEEDLDFERTGKPVPVISQEVSDDIEELVKRRIIAKEFDELIRRPHMLAAQGPRSADKFVLDDNKAEQSLAQLYETEHLRATDPGYVDKKSAKLRKDHAEVTQLWNNIRSQLDALSSWHYRPSAPQADINVVRDVATVSMEDQRPSAGGHVDVVGTLAPHEIYAPGDDGVNRGEIVQKSGAPIAKEEMSREARLRRRRREKQKLRKQAAGSNATKQGGKAEEKKQVAADLKKGNVKIIGKGGDIKDMRGNKVQPQEENKSREFLKL